MSKVVGAVIVFLVLQTAIFMFSGSGMDCGTDECELAGYSSEANNTIMAYFTDPASHSTSTFWNLLFGTTAGLLAVLTAGGVIVVGAAWLTKDINVAYISVMLALMGGLIGTYVQFWGIVNNSALLGGSSGGVVVLVLVGTLIATQIFNLADWGRGLS